jgi:hypothetical protein
MIVSIQEKKIQRAWQATQSYRCLLFLCARPQGAPFPNWWWKPVLQAHLTMENRQVPFWEAKHSSIIKRKWYLQKHDDSNAGFYPVFPCAWLTSAGIFYFLQGRHGTGLPFPQDRILTSQDIVMSSDCWADKVAWFNFNGNFIFHETKIHRVNV